MDRRRACVLRGGEPNWAGVPETEGGKLEGGGKRCTRRAPVRDSTNCVSAPRQRPPTPIWAQLAGGRPHWQSSRRLPPAPATEWHSGP